MKRTPYLAPTLIIVIVFCSTLLLAPAVSAQSNSPVLFVPLIISARAECAHSDQEQALIDLIRTSPEQGRPAFTCNPLLQKAARNQSQDMAARDYCTTIDPDGYGPNHRVRSAGYVLPKHYSTSQDANNVQTVGCGYATAQDLWNALRPSDHLEGKGDFWGKQVEYGIAHYEAADRPFIHYWVIITAEPGQQ